MLQHVQQDRTRHGPGDSSMISAVGSCVQIRTRPCYYQLEHLWKMLMMRWIMATPILSHIQHDGHTLTTTDGEQVIAETIDVGHCQKQLASCKHGTAKPSTDHSCCNSHCHTSAGCTHPLHRCDCTQHCVHAQQHPQPTNPSACQI